MTHLQFYHEFLNNPTTEYYRHVYHFSRHWNGRDSLESKRLIIYCSHGLGDVIQLARFLPVLKRKHGCHVILHAPTCLHDLLLRVEGVDECYDRNDPFLPPHDYHVIMLGLPFMLKNVAVDPAPYIHVSEKTDLSEVSGKKIGIAWECSAHCPISIKRCCPLKHFAPLAQKGTLFKVTDKIHRPALVESCDLEIFGVELLNWLDTAKLLNALDLVVSVDTAVLHLAGAMGVPAYAVLCGDYDLRWEDSNWYDCVKLKIAKDGWSDDLFKEIANEV